MSEDRTYRAKQLFERAHELQMAGELDLAVALYKQSLAVLPTAEAHTFLGWTYRFQGKLEQAIEECKKAIEVDPGFGNPYNDIGAYLLEMERVDDAIPWLEKAVASPRYQPRHYAWYNLGRVYTLKEMFRRARECFSKALELDPDYALAREELDRVKRIVQ